MEHIVLEYDKDTRTALVVATSGGREPVLSGHASPYIVADGYDFESRTWGAGHYFTDIAQAKIDYERSCRHAYPLAEGKLRDDEFCTIRWCREDIADALSEYLTYPIPATEKNIDAAIGQLMFRDGLRDRSTEDGWETIGAIIDEDELDFGISSAQGVDFYKEAFDLSVRTDAVIWPSSEGDAAFVMACPTGSEDGDLAVYKIDGGLIGDDEITVDDIERLGGTRMLCVYKHGPDGIEGIRDFANRMAIHEFRERVTVRDPFGDLPDLAPALRNAAAPARAAVQQLRDLEDVGCREVYVEDFTERPDEVRFFLRTDADAYMFGSSLGKSLTVQYTGKEDIAPALREVRAYCKDAAEKRDPCLIGAMAQASAAKSATAEGEAGGKKL